MSDCVPLSVMEALEMVVEVPFEAMSGFFHFNIASPVNMVGMFASEIQVARAEEAQRQWLGQQ